MRSNVLRCILLLLCVASLWAIQSTNAAELGRLCISGKTVVVRRLCRANERTLQLKMLDGAHRCNPAVKGERGSKGIRGEAGVVGEQGHMGLKGLQGAPSTSFGDLIPSGTLAFGSVSGDFEGDVGDTHQLFASFLGSSPHAVSVNNIVVKVPNVVLDGCNQGLPCVALIARAEQQQNRCKGNASDPDPDLGTLCVYPTYLLNVEGLEGGLTQSSFGFSLKFNQGDAARFSAFAGVWAYRAP